MLFYDSTTVKKSALLRNTHEARIKNTCTVKGVQMGGIKLFWETQNYSLNISANVGYFMALQ
jgi:hypothetical protein